MIDYQRKTCKKISLRIAYCYFKGKNHFGKNKLFIPHPRSLSFWEREAMSRNFSFEKIFFYDNSSDSSRFF